ncbi:chemotaxis protein CheA [Clostridium chromiireducens]|uniref:Chemotaxis protein CheA n=1 Tax=Clostridium chromiireducens TaxID=225345 RepID=A0A399IWV3_9CLOT|nr:chemotaxis protein CheA [Clostridium chromiireducens]RII36719.1 chemotaxis protein CheA [Clostridium chromiireducens]
MSENIINESMLDMYIFETTQLIEQLEQLVINGEKENGFTDSINEIFRIMHTVKGSSAMMLFNNIAEISHSVEDLFYYLRENRPTGVDNNILSDIVLDAIDFIKNEVSKIQEGKTSDGDAANRINEIKEFLNELKKENEISTVVEMNNAEPQKFFITSGKVREENHKNKYKANISFVDGCGMENIRCFGILHKLSEIAEVISNTPENIIDDDEKASEEIRQNGFEVKFSSNLDVDMIKSIINETVFLSRLDISVLDEENDCIENKNIIEKVEINEVFKSNEKEKDTIVKENKGERTASHQGQGFISLSVSKADRLMDLIGELVIAESMVTQNPDLAGLELDNFQKSARQLRKIITEMQDTVMSVRMVPLSATFQKMNRIVRDMSKKMNKEVKLTIIGEETEVDKNIIEHISDPLMHLVRNSIDHGIETSLERVDKGKQPIGNLILEAKNAGSDVLVVVKDDGKGLDERKILERARENGLLNKHENEMTKREIFNLIFSPGFSTKDAVSEYSGRGVGMDVVMKNIEKIGGAISIDSVEDFGSTMTIKIPLTLAIIDGMNVRVGDSRYTLPTSSIKEFFRPKESDIIRDPDNNEIIMVRGHCYPILRLNEHFGVRTSVTNLSDGILIMVEQDERKLCILIDELLGQQQVVVKALPSFIRDIRNSKDLAGCTLLGDGNISLIIDITGLIAKL